MSDANKLADRLEYIQTTSLKRAHEAYAKEVEQGMNEMIQLARQQASLIPESALPIVNSKNEETVNAQ